MGTAMLTEPSNFRPISPEKTGLTAETRSSRRMQEKVKA